jgi:hypothetical protein
MNVLEKWLWAPRIAHFLEWGVFKSFSLLPKHIINFHWPNVLCQKSAITSSRRNLILESELVKLVLLIFKRFSTSLPSIIPQQIYRFYKTHKTKPNSRNPLTKLKETSLYMPYYHNILFCSISLMLHD